MGDGRLLFAHSDGRYTRADRLVRSSAYRHKRRSSPARLAQHAELSLDTRRAALRHHRADHRRELTQRFAAARSSTSACGLGQIRRSAARRQRRNASWAKRLELQPTGVVTGMSVVACRRITEGSRRAVGIQVGRHRRDRVPSSRCGGCAPARSIGVQASMFICSVSRRSRLVSGDNGWRRSPENIAWSPARRLDIAVGARMMTAWQASLPGEGNSAP